jgi:hypothetical protein
LVNSSSASKPLYKGTLKFEWPPPLSHSGRTCMHSLPISVIILGPEAIDAWNICRVKNVVLRLQNYLD